MKNQSSYEKHCDFSISVLEQIINGTPYNEISVPGYTQKEIDELAYQFAENDIIVCIDKWRDGNFDPHVEFPKGLTLKGYKYLNDLHATSADRLAKQARTDSLFAKTMSVISVIISLLTLVFSIISLVV